MAINKIVYNNNTLIDLTSDTVTADKLIEGYTAHDRTGAVITGTATSGGSGDGYVWQDGNGYVHLSDEQGTLPITDSLTVSASGTYNAPTGHVYNPVIVPSGTAGTPSATKGTVSGHAVTVTPSVTNTTGWITGSTKTGTGVSVSASELVSGTYSVTSSGTKDVTNYASASVPAGTATAPSTISGSSATVSTGTNTLTLSKTVSVTPTISTAGYISSGTAGNASVSLTASVNTRSSSDLTASGATVTAPAGYYATQATKSVSSGSATAPATISGTSASVSTGTNTLTLSKTVSVTPSVTAGYVSSGTAGNSAVSLTASVNTRSSSDLTASTLTVTAPSGYYASNATKTLSDANLTAGNIKKDVSIFGVTGSYEGGGGGSNWSWYGTNAENVKHHVVKRKFSETAFASWTPTTTSTNLETITTDTVTADFSNYSYTFVYKYYADFVYNTGVTLSAAPSKCFGLFYSEAYLRYNSLTNYQAHTKSTSPTTLSTISKNPLLYYNTAGTLTFSSSSTYGVYPSGLSVATTSDSVSLSTTIRARCNTSYFSTSMAEEIDQDASTYTVILDIYRVPINVDQMAGFEEELYGIYANGLPTT